MNPTKKIRHEEDGLQIACVQWFRAQYPKILIHHSPSGGRRAFKINKKGKRYCPEGGRFKAMGTKAGFPDLFIAKPKYGAMPKNPAYEQQPLVIYHGLFVEMKSEDGRLSDSQLITGEMLTRAGYKVEVAKSLDDFMMIVNDYLK